MSRLLFNNKNHATCHFWVSRDQTTISRGFWNNDLLFAAHLLSSVWCFLSNEPYCQHFISLFLKSFTKKRSSKIVPSVLSQGFPGKANKKFDRSIPSTKIPSNWWWKQINCKMNINSFHTCLNSDYVRILCVTLYCTS